MTTSITYVRFDRLSARGDDAVLIVKLMMAFNDVAIANEGLADCKKRLAEKRTDKDRGAALYFIRLQAAHLVEAMTVVDQVAKSRLLRQLISTCPQPCLEAFARLVDIRTDRAARKKFNQYFEVMRNNVTFHYNESGKQIAGAIGRCSKSPQVNTSSITRGTEPYSWRFNVADDIVDSIVCRDIWKIPDNADLRVEADAAADYGHAIFLDFVNFCTELIPRYVRE
jgi:hypothetical protein